MHLHKLYITYPIALSPIFTRFFLAPLIQSYRTKYINDIEKNLNIIEKEGKLSTSGRVFDSPEKYLDFKVNSLNKEYAPQEALEQKQEQIKESQNQKAAIEISRSFGDFER